LNCPVSSGTGTTLDTNGIDSSREIFESDEYDAVRRGGQASKGEWRRNHIDKQLSIDISPFIR